MTGWDFVAGIGAGIILACVSFVVSSSQRRAIRSILTGAVARSTVRRHPKQSAFLKEVGRQTRVIKLQGFLFFGTISACETTIRKILEAASWSKNPIRFLVLDFSMASGELSFRFPSSLLPPKPTLTRLSSLLFYRRRLLCRRSVRADSAPSREQGRRPRPLWLPRHLERRYRSA